MISVVIRNKNEAAALENTLYILTKVYADDLAEIILVDNHSTDDSVSVAKKYNCKIVTITNFSYGKATNLGISEAASPYVLLLSSHAIPVGDGFFKNTLKALESSDGIAGIRYINSIGNYQRALQNNFIVNDPLRFGLMTGCALVNKSVWELHKFDEKLVFSEDKEWSERVVKNGFQIRDLNETFFYDSKRSRQSNLNRFKNETLSEYQLHPKKYPSRLKLLASFLKKILLTNTKNYFGTLTYDFLILRSKFAIHKLLRKNGKNQ